MSEIIRLDKFLSSQLNISRSDAKKLLREGNVQINGVAVKKGDCSVSIGEDTVTVAGRVVQYKKYVYIMQNKPKGVVSASVAPSDITVIDILPGNLKRNGLFPAGRLDKDTTGFVLITDDGEFAHNILSPAHHVEKTYIVEIAAELNDEDMRRFFEGMKVGNEIFNPACVEYVGRNGENSVYKVIISEGRYHQIRRMFASTGNPVVELRRIKIGNLALDEALSPGESREISLDELKQIKS